MGFSRQVNWSGLLCLPPGDLPDPRMESMSSAAPALLPDSLLLSHRGSPMQPNSLPHYLLLEPLGIQCTMGLSYYSLFLLSHQLE